MDPLYAELLRGRSVRTSTPTFLDISFDENKQLAEYLGGTVSVFLYRTSTRAAALVAAVAGGERTAVHDLVLAAEGYRSRLERLLGSKQAVSLGLLADVRYGAKTLRQGLTLPQGIDLVVDQYVFAGGRLEAGKFQLLEHCAPGDDDDYASLVVVGQPQLSELERQVIERLPADLSELSISEIDAMWPNVLNAALAQRVRNVDDLAQDRVVQRLADQGIADRLADRLARVRNIDDLADDRIADRLAQRLADQGIADRLADRLARVRNIDDLADDRIADRLAQRLADQGIADRLADRLARVRNIDDLADDRIADRLAQRLADQGIADRLADRLARVRNIANLNDSTIIADRLAGRNALDDLGAGAFGGRATPLPDDLLAGVGDLDPGAAVREILAVRNQLARRRR